jgi:hypothetical protein
MLKKTCVKLLFTFSATSFNLIAQEPDSLNIKLLYEKDKISNPMNYDYESFSLDEYQNDKNKYLIDFFIAKNNNVGNSELKKLKRVKCKKDIYTPKNSIKNNKSPYVLISETYENNDVEDLPVNLVLIVPVPGDIKTLNSSKATINVVEKEYLDTTYVENSNYQKIASAKSTSFILDKTGNRLFQNVPNPFDYETNVNYEIASEVKKAIIRIHNMQGRILKEIEIQERGRGSIIVTKDKMLSETCVCVLIVDGKVESSILMNITP